jgi:hypothetical protein
MEIQITKEKFFVAIQQTKRQFTENLSFDILQYLLQTLNSIQRWSETAAELIIEYNKIIYN